MFKQLMFDTYNTMLSAHGTMKHSTGWASYACYKYLSWYEPDELNKWKTLLWKCVKMFVNEVFNIMPGKSIAYINCNVRISMFFGSNNVI